MHLGNDVPQTQAFACGESLNPAPALGETRPEGEEAGSHLGKTFFPDPTPDRLAPQGPQAVHFMWKAVEAVDNGSGIPKHA